MHKKFLMLVIGCSLHIASSFAMEEKFQKPDEESMKTPRVLFRRERFAGLEEEIKLLEEEFGPFSFSDVYVPRALDSFEEVAEEPNEKAEEVVSHEDDLVAQEQVAKEVVVPGQKELFKALDAAIMRLNLNQVQEIITVGAPLEYKRKSALFSVLSALKNESYCAIQLNGNKDGRMQRSAQKAQEIMRFLIEQGASVNVTTKVQVTPLMCAAMVAQKDLVVTLLKAGADKELVDKDGNSAWDYADTISEELKHAYGFMTPDPLYTILFSYKEYNDDREACIELLKPHAESLRFEKYCARQEEIKKRANFQLLFEAVDKLDIDTARNIVTNGITFYTDGYLGMYCGMLLTNVANGYPKDMTSDALKNVRKTIRELTVLLVKNGLDVNRQNMREQTPLMIAAVTAHKGLVKTLLQLGARTDIQDGDATVFDYADSDSDEVKNNLRDKDFYSYIVTSCGKPGKLCKEDLYYYEKSYEQGKHSKDVYEAKLAKIHALLKKSESEKLA